MKMILKILFVILFAIILWEILFSLHSINEGKSLHAFNEEIFYKFTYPGSDESHNVLLIGDSIGAGIGASSFNNSLGSILGKYLANELEANIFLENRAVSGNKIKDIVHTNVSRKRYDTIIIIGSSNDVFKFTSNSEFRESVKKLFEKYSPLSDEIILVGPGKIYSTSGVPFFFKPFYYNKGKQIGKIIKEESEKYDAVIHINPHDTLSLKDYGNIEAKDNFHPNDSGHKYWADMVKLGIK